MESAEEKSGRIKEPVIVVSDVHLGGKESNEDDFRDFLKWLSTLPLDGKIYASNGSKITIKRPGTLVLLGDILELWDPEEDDRNNALMEVLKPLTILNELDCDSIYVIGNHDEDLLDFRSVWRAWRKKNGEFLAKGSFDIKYRSYPWPGSDGVTKGKPIGQHTYAFLHGQQFDRLQVFYRLSKFFSKKMKRQVRIDPIDWFQDLANVSFTRNIGLKRNGASVIFGVLLVLYLLLSYVWFTKVPLGSGWGILWVIISSFFVLTILPKVVSFANTEIWRRIPGIVVKKCKSVEDVIKERYIDKKGKYIDADVIVFGHTHYPGIYYMEEKKRLFINSGGWVKISKECEEKGVVPNTFLYIDAEAPHLLQWNKEQVAKREITCLEDFKGLL